MQGVSSKLHKIIESYIESKELAQVSRSSHEQPIEAFS